MVQRTSSPVDFGGQQQQSIAQVQGGLVGPDVQAERVLKDDTTSNRVLQGIIGDLQRTVKISYDKRLEDAYLRGVAQISTAASEAELEADQFTRDWTVAGYRDMAGKLLMANAEAQLQVDMATLRQKSPEEMQKYVTQMQAKLRPSLEGMSREQRNAALAHMGVSANAAIQRHRAEHSAFIVEQEQQGVSRLIGQAFEASRIAQTNADPKAFASSIDSAYLAVQRGIWENPKFNDGLKRKLTQEAMEQALAADNTTLYEMLAHRRTEIAGRTTTMFDELDIGNQEKMAGKYREAAGRTSAARNSMYLDTLTRFRSEMDAGTYSGTYDELVQYLDQGQALGVVSPEKRDSTLTKYHNSRLTAVQAPALANAYRTGSAGTWTSLGKTEEDAQKAVDADLTRAGVPLDQRMLVHVQAGQNGSTSGYKRAGTLASTTIAQLARGDGTLDPEHVQTYQTINALVDGFDRGDDSGKIAKQSFLAGMSPQNALRLERMRQFQMQEKVTPEVALTKTLELERQDLTMDQRTRDAMRAQSSVEDAAFLSSIEAEGPLGRFGLWVRSLWSSEATLLSAVVPSTDLIGGPPDTVLDGWTGIARDAVASELSTLGVIGGVYNSERRFDLATAAVQRRTIKTEHSGPVIIPQGSTAAGFFGVNADTSTIAKAIDAVLKPSAAGNKFAVRVRGNELVVQQYNSAGDALGPSRPISATEIGAEVKRQREHENARADIQVGAGKIAKKDGLAVRYNGENGAAASPEMMLEFRDNLVQNEGIRNEVYRDTLGNLTFGVGISGDYIKKFIGENVQPGTPVPQEVLNMAFRVASNDAAKAGMDFARRAKLGEKGFVLSAELAYQGGPAWYKNPVNVEFAKALQSGDTEAAAHAFTKTTFYSVSGKDRREHYLNLINKTMS